MALGHRGAAPRPGGERWSPTTSTFHFYPVVALPEDERDEWHRIVLSAIADTNGIMTIVFVEEPSGWILRGAAGPRPCRVLLLPRGRFLPLRSRVISALKSAGKRVRTP